VTATGNGRKRIISYICAVPCYIVDMVDLPSTSHVEDCKHCICVMYVSGSMPTIMQYSCTGDASIRRLRTANNRNALLARDKQW
jgi:hypothetical protein